MKGGGRPCRIGWMDQIRMVLATADGPLSTVVIGERARVIPTGRYADPDIAKRPAGGVGQDAYCLLIQLVERGDALRAPAPSASDRTVYWKAAPGLRREMSRSVALLESLFEIPARRASQRAPKPKRPQR